MVEARARGSENVQPVRNSRTAAREERKEQPKKETPKPESRPVRREAKGSPSLMTRFRASRAGRFIFEAYNELRHKVTWPTFEEARNMTIAVIVISAVIGGILSLADLGLLHLFVLLVGGK
jgi:preprotein translocase SecE subunit